ncbi:DUF721 domain-containing protein [Tepidamorphus sp. 3E244]|uniref:DUF721 domain-containing protein n=1 Tax=Tepidamorphus sp. 3E244 TaxID=3385498 RepID=UPI0038FC2108
MSRNESGNVKKKLGVRAVGQIVPGLVAPSARKFGFASSDLIAQWSVIVGEDIAEICAPDRIQWPRQAPDPEDGSAKAAATLHLRVPPEHVLRASHETTLVAERVNAFFGYKAIEKVVVHRRETAASEPEGDALPRQPEHREKVSGFSDEGLSDALSELGGFVRQADD